MQEKGASNQSSSQKSVYVPPHRRPHRESTENGSTGQNGARTMPNGMGSVYAYDSIQSHFWPLGEDYKRESSRGIDDALATTHDGINTLHDSAERMGKLAYITLFSEGNPRWEKDGIIFVKSNLALLEPYRSKTETTIEDYVMVDTEKNNPPTTTTYANRSIICDGQTIATSSKPSQQDFTIIQKALPIPVFSYERKFAEVELFSFIGHFRILRIDMLEPYSEELKRMMKQKWEVPQAKLMSRRRTTTTPRRDERKWDESFSRPWAVVQLVPAEEVEVGEEVEEEKEGKEQQEESIREENGMAGRGEKWRRRPGGFLNARLEKKLEPYDFESSRVTRELRRMRMVDDEAATATTATT